MVDDAARAAALATGTKVKIDHYGEDRDGIGVGSLNEVAFAYMKKYGGHGVQPEPGQAAGLRGDGERLERDSRRRVQREDVERTEPHVRDGAGRARRRSDIRASSIDAQAMAALLFDFATRADYRATVKREFDTIRGLHTEYLEDLKKVYGLPKVPEP